MTVMTVNVNIFLRLQITKKTVFNQPVAQWLKKEMVKESSGKKKTKWKCPIGCPLHFYPCP